MFSPAALTEVLLSPVVAVADLVPFAVEFLRADPAVPTVPLTDLTPLVNLTPPGGWPDPLTVVAAPALFAAKVTGSVVGTFDDPAWHLHKRLWGVTYDRVGEFHNPKSVRIDVRGERDYAYRPVDPPMYFQRASGEFVQPASMLTDGGSVPRVVWAIPGLNPWAYLPAFLVHDYQFVQHHCTPGYDKSFEEVNQTLAEGVYTMMMTGMADPDWRVLVAIHAAVNSFIGKQVWSRQWSPDQCQLVLNP